VAAAWPASNAAAEMILANIFQGICKYSSLLKEVYVKAKQRAKTRNLSFLYWGGCGMFLALKYAE
jgi:hypothetical protein